MSESSSSSRLLHLLGGPALLLLALALPIFGPIESRFGFGILFWMSGGGSPASWTSS